MEDNPSTSPSSSGVDHDQWDVRSETDNSSSLSLMTRSDPTELPHLPVSHSHGDIPESPPPHEESPSAPPQPKEIDDSAELHPPMSNIQQSAIAVEDPASCPPLGTDSGNDYQSALRARGEGRDQQSPESDGSSMLSYVTLGHVPAVPATRSQSDIPGSIHSHKDDSSVPAQESHELPKAPRASDTQCPISLHADSPRASQTSSAPEARDDPRWNEWREWREWKMEQEWQEFRRWEEGRKRNNVQASHTANTDEQRAESAGEQAQLVPTQAAVNPMVTPEQSEEKGGVRTEYVLSGQPTGWAAIDKVLRDFDEEKVKYCKEDIDTLLVFAGLFSAVLTAFLIESYQNLTANESSNNGSSGDSSASHPSDGQPAAPFQPSSADIRVNVLWFASLLFSLISASFGILVKQWLREYMAVQNPSPQARLRLRHLRYPQLAIWKVFEIAAVLPLLLQLSLSLFFIGLCYFTGSIHASVGYTTLPLVIFWAICIVITAILPLFMPRCPYHTTFLKAGISNLRRAVRDLCSKVTLDGHDHNAQSSGRGTGRCKLILQPFSVGLRRVLWIFANKIDASDEGKVVQRADEDLSILAAADAVQSNDELLSTSIVEAVKQSNFSAQAVLDFLQAILTNRLVLPAPQVSANQNLSCYSLVVDLRSTSLSHRSREAILDIVHEHLQSYEHVNCPLDDSGELMLPVLSLVMLFVLSGRSIDHIPSLTAALARKESGIVLALHGCLCLEHSASSFQGQSRLKEIQRDLLMCVSRLRRISRARWQFLPVLRMLTTEGSGDRDCGIVSVLRPLVIINTFYRSMTTVQGDDSFNDSRLGNLGNEVKTWFLRNLRARMTQFIGRIQDFYEGSEDLEYLEDQRITTAGRHVLTSSTLRAMLNVTSWMKLINIPPAAVVEPICEELEWTLKNRVGRYASIVDAKNNQITLRHPVDLITLELVFAFLFFQCRLREREYWSKIAPFLFDSPDRGYTLAFTICHCVHTVDILRFCVRAVNESVLYKWGAGSSWLKARLGGVATRCPSAFRHAIEDPSINSDAITLLKLFAFSIYFLLSSTMPMVRLSFAAEEWQNLFESFAENIDRLGVAGALDAVAPEASLLATICLEIIRYEQVCLYGLHHALSANLGRFSEGAGADSASSLLPADILRKRWRTFAPQSVFRETMVDALERVAHPSWESEVESRFHHSEIRLQDYYLAYVAHIDYLVSSVEPGI